MPFDEDLEAWLRLSLVPGLDGGKLRELLAVYSDPRRILAAGRAALTRYVSGPIAAAIARDADIDTMVAVRRWLEDPANHIVTLADPGYPCRLKQIADPPPLLYVKGRSELLQQPALAIVGSRNATAQGVANAESFAQALSNAGLVIVSGLALGIDAAAHRGGLAGSSSSIGRRSSMGTPLRFHSRRASSAAVINAARSVGSHASSASSAPGMRKSARICRRRSRRDGGALFMRVLR